MTNKRKSILDEVDVPSSNETIEPPKFVAEPIFEVKPTIDPELAAAVHSLDPDVIPAPSVMEALYSLSEQQREQIVYGIVEMGNPASEVAAAFGVEPEVALMAIQIAKQAAEAHAQDQL